MMNGFSCIYSTVDLLYEWLSTLPVHFTRSCPIKIKFIVIRMHLLKDLWIAIINNKFGGSYHDVLHNVTGSLVYYKGNRLHCVLLVSSMWLSLLHHISLFTFNFSLINIFCYVFLISLYLFSHLKRSQICFIILFKMHMAKVYFSRTHILIFKSKFCNS